MGGLLLDKEGQENKRTSASRSLSILKEQQEKGKEWVDRVLSRFNERQKKIILLGLGGICLFLLFGFFLKGDDQELVARPPRQVKTILLEGEDAVGRRFFPGRVAAAQEVELAFRVGGILALLPASAGQSVDKGELLAQLDKRDYEIGLQAAESELGYARTQIAQMRTGARPEDIIKLNAQLASAQAHLDEATITFKRVSALFAEKAIAEVEVDRARTRLQVAKTNHEAAKQELQIGRTGARVEDIQGMIYRIKGLEAQVAAARNNILDSELRAPFAGVVAARYVENFQGVKKDQKILSLQNLAEVEILINLPETLFTVVKRPGTTWKADARFENLPGKTFPVKLKEITTQADPQTQTYATRFIMGRPEGALLLPGMTAEIGFTLNDNEATEEAGEIFFHVPSGSVSAGEGKDHKVWVVDEKTMTVRPVSVTVVGFQGENAIISGDLKVNDRIVVAGANFLQEGEPVTLFEKPQ